jgi:sugar transferase (PEP-CTERM system associated)
MVRVFSQYVSVKSLLLILLEGTIMIAALVCGAKLRFWKSPTEFGEYTQLPDFGWQVLLFVLVFLTCFYYGNLYDLSSIRQRHERWIFLGQSLGAGCLVLGLLYYALPGLLIGRGVFFISTSLLILFVTLDRLLLEAVWRVLAPKENTLILGTHELALTIAEEFGRRDDLNIRLAGFVAATADTADELCGHPVFGTTANLQQITLKEHINRIVVALEDRRGTLPIRDLVRLRVQGIRVEDAQTTVAALTGRVWLRTVRPSWFVFSDGFHRSRLTLVMKRAIDLAFGLLGLAMSLPLMAIVAIAIRLDSKGPAIYRQERVGLGDRPFHLFKFRSMRVDAEVGETARWAIEDDPRVTRVGRFLRKFRLDELPQFFNVIRGDMSFVGPRPERPVFVEMLRKEISYYDERHSVRPGITGWAQVQYRYGACVEDAFRKLEYDLFYLKNMSVLFDCAIVLRTVRIVLTGFGGR